MRCPEGRGGLVGYGCLWGCGPLCVASLRVSPAGRDNAGIAALLCLSPEGGLGLLCLVAQRGRWGLPVQVPGPRYQVPPSAARLPLDRLMPLAYDELTVLAKGLVDVKESYGERMHTVDTDRRDQIVQVAGELLEREGPAGSRCAELPTNSVSRRLRSTSTSPTSASSRSRSSPRAFEISETPSRLLSLKEATRLPSSRSTYRRWALERPHLYALMNSRPLPQDAPAIATEQRALAMVLAAFSGDHERARAAWAFAHGMVTLELADRFPQDADIERTWSIGIAAFAHEPNSPKGSMQ